MFNPDFAVGVRFQLQNLGFNAYEINIITSHKNAGNNPAF
jgi:hypothetical protein